MCKMTMADVRADVPSFFSRGAMEFFGSRIESSLMKGDYFITSEVPPYEGKRYTVRWWNRDGRIKSMGKGFTKYPTKEDAKEAIKELQKEREA